MTGVMKSRPLMFAVTATAAALLTLGPVSAVSHSQPRAACAAKYRTAKQARCAARSRSSYVGRFRSHVRFGAGLGSVLGRVESLQVRPPLPLPPAPAMQPDTLASPAPVGPPLLGTGRAVQVIGSEFSLRLSRPEVLAGSVRMEYNLTGAEDPHSLVIVRENSDGPMFRFAAQAAESVESKRFDLTPGKWLLFCDLDGHAAKGMQTQLTVR
jgi:hypothetical protein